MKRRTYIVIEAEINPDGGHKNILTCFHGLFDSYEAADKALHTVAEIMMENPKYYPENQSVIGIIEGKKSVIYIQGFSKFNEVVI